MSGGPCEERKNCREHTGKAAAGTKPSEWWEERTMWGRERGKESIRWALGKSVSRVLSPSERGR